MLPIALLLLVGLACFRLILWPLYFSSLSKIPAAHPLCRFTSLYITYIRWKERENRFVHTAHLEKGPVVLLGPNELAVNCVQDGIWTIYGKNFEKDAYYEVFANYNRRVWPDKPQSAT
jgi:hypothetical protein